MREMQNRPAIRPAYILAPQTTNPIPLGSVGNWLDRNGIEWKVAADGSSRAVSANSAASAPPVRLATAAALPSYVYALGVITAAVAAAWTIDGKTLTVGDRILLKDGAADTDNGIYVVTTKGTGSVKTVLTRANDMSTSGSISAGLMILTSEDGVANAGILFELQTPAPFVLDTTPLFFGVLAEQIASGVVPAARMAFSANPTDADTITIGGSSFTFKTTLVAATTTTQVKILGSAALTLAALLDAINGVANVNVVANTTPFAAKIVADAVTATVLRVRKALSNGGAVVPGIATSTTLACSITAGASAWSAANLNVSGKYPKVTITAAMVTNGSFQLEFDFTPTAFICQVNSSTGVQRASTDAITISSNAINIALAGGASPAIQAGDIVTVFVA